MSVAAGSSRSVMLVVKSVICILINSIASRNFVKPEHLTPNLVLVGLVTSRATKKQVTP